MNGILEHGWKNLKRELLATYSKFFTPQTKGRPKSSSKARGGRKTIKGKAKRSRGT